MMRERGHRHSGARDEEEATREPPHRQVTRGEAGDRVRNERERDDQEAAFQEPSKAKRVQSRVIPSAPLAEHRNDARKARESHGDLCENEEEAGVLHARPSISMPLSSSGDSKPAASISAGTSTQRSARPDGRFGVLTLWY